MMVAGYTTTLAATRAIMDDDRPLLEEPGSVQDPEGGPGDTSTRWAVGDGTMTATYGDLTATVRLPALSFPLGEFRLTPAEVGRPMVECGFPDLLAAMEAADHEANRRGWNAAGGQPASAP